MKDQFARILAAASILSSSEEPVLKKLANVIGEDLSTIYLEVFKGIVDDEVFQLMLKHQELLMQSMPKENIAEKKHIQLIN